MASKVCWTISLVFNCVRPIRSEICLTISFLVTPGFSCTKEFGRVRSAALANASNVEAVKGSVKGTHETLECWSTPEAIRWQSPREQFTLPEAMSSRTALSRKKLPGSQACPVAKLIWEIHAPATGAMRCGSLSQA